MGPTGLDRAARRSLLYGDRDDLRHEAGRRRIGADTRVKHPPRQQTVRALRRERVRQPIAARLQQLARERRDAAAAEAAQRLGAEHEVRRRPQLGAEYPEREVGVREEALEHAGPRRI